MKFITTAQFERDFKKLPKTHRQMFIQLIPAFNDACDKYATSSTLAFTKWPSSLRVHPMKSAKGVWEMTWSFSGPDGRATFDFVAEGNSLSVRWRRIGYHDIYREP